MIRREENIKHSLPSLREKWDSQAFFSSFKTKENIENPLVQYSTSFQKEGEKKLTFPVFEKAELQALSGVM